MSKNYSIDKTTQTLVFTGKPVSLKKNCVEKTDRTSFTSVYIPNSVSNIKAWAFLCCRSLASVLIPNSVSTIGGEAFFDCSSLASVLIPNSVSAIGDRAFTHCTSLASVHIPKSVSTIGQGAFDNCNSLASVHIPRSTSNINFMAFYLCSHFHKAFITPHHLAHVSFNSQTNILRPRLNPITSLQKKPACRASKASDSIYL